MAADRQKRYGLLDFIGLPFRCAPAQTLYTLITTGIQALIPSFEVLAVAAFIDTALKAFSGEAALSAVWPPMLALVAFVAFRYIDWTVATLTNTSMELRLNKTFRAQTFEKRASLAFSHIENNDDWDLIGRVCKDPGARVRTGLGSTLTLCSQIVTLVSVLALVMAQVWWAGLLILGFTVPLFWVSMRAGKRRYEANKEAEKHSRRAQYLSKLLSEREGAEERAAFGYTDAMNERWNARYEKARLINAREELKQFVQIKGTGLVQLLISFLIALVLLFPLRSAEITAGMYIGLVTAAFNLVQSLSWTLPYALSQLAENREYMKDLTAFFSLSEREGALDRPQSNPAFTLADIRFEHVSFRYPGGDREILKDLNMTLKAGRHYAFVGVNGAGKTTITKLLTGLYDNYEGSILINGKELREYPLARVKALFSVAHQDFARYAVTMRENLSLGDQREGATPDVEAAASAIGLQEAIAALPSGMDTPLGKIKEDGMDISGGEWQRVALARCLCSPAQARILDEPTAALDPMAESKVYELFGRVSAGHTTVFITHRLGAARLADEIIVLDDGHVAQVGSHDELMRAGGLYADMFESQRSWYV